MSAPKGVNDAGGTRPWLEAAIDVSGSELRLDTEGVDWERLVESTEVNRLDVRLDPIIRAHDGVPEATKKSIRDQAAQVKLLGLESFSWTIRMIDRLEGEGIPTIAYKGPVLSERLYQNPGTRRFLDLDLIVPKADVPKAMELMAADGWKPKEEWNDEVLAKYLREDCEISIYYPGKSLRVEIHWDLLPPTHQFGLTMEDIWPRVQTRQVSGRDLRCFSVEDELLVLCVHAGEKHRWMRLSMTADVAQLIKTSPELDWNLARETARNVGREETLLAGATLAALVAGANVPTELLTEAAATPDLVYLVALVRGRPFKQGRGLPSYQEWKDQLAETIAQFQARNVDCTVTDSRSQYAKALLRPDWADREAVPLPPALSPLWWLIRPVRFFKKHGLGKLLRRV